MANFKDVDYSKQGEQAAELTAPIVNDAPKTEPLPLPRETGLPGIKAVQTERQYIIFKLVIKTRNGGINIPNIDDVVNPATRKVERIRLLTGVDTIWQKEQKDLAKEYVEKNGRTLYFPRGAKFIRIDKLDHTALEFARLCRHNIGAPSRRSGSKCEFYEYDPMREAKEAEEKEFMELEMAIKAKEMPAEKMKKHASFLNINPINDLGLLKQDQQIRAEYMLYAKRNPVWFKQTMDSERVDLQYAIKMAIQDARIDIGRQPGAAFWSNSNGIICRLPPNKNPIEYLTELAETNTPEGRTFKDQLKQIMT
jgi:hypothetical protein